MFKHPVDSAENISLIGRSSLVITWILLLAVTAFSLANLLVYLLVPIDGASLSVRQGPIRVTNTGSMAPSDQTGTPPLHTGDIILAVQGHDMGWWLAEKWRALPEILTRTAPLPVIEVTRQRDEAIQAEPVQLEVRPGGPLRIQLVTHLLVSFAYLAVSLLILKLRGWDPVARIAALIMLLLALAQSNDLLPLMGVEWGIATLWLFLPIRLLTRWFAYSLVLHFSLVFPTPKTWFQRLPGLSWGIHLLNPVVTLAIMLSVDGNLQERHSAAYAGNKNIYILFLALACIFLIHSYFRAKTHLARIQMRWIAWGAAFAIVPNLLLYDLPIVLVGYNLLPSVASSLLLLLVPISAAVAILRYRLWDIDLVIRASLVYGMLSLALGAAYALLVLVLIAFVGATGVAGAASNPAIYFISALIVVLLLNPARQYLQQLIDRFFYRNKLDYSRLLNDLSRRLSTSLLFDELITLLNETIPERLNLESGQVLLGISPPHDSPAYKTLREGHIVWLHRLNGEALSVPPPITLLQEQGYWACLPILSGSKLLGIYGVGRKKSGEFYSTNDIELLETLARQAGVAFQNAQYHQDLANQVRLDRELEIARQIQLSLLPSQDPIFPGLDIAGFSIPAQSVGGDFYHYFNGGDDHLGVAVGDVSGKGVPAALLMAVSTSTLRAQSPHLFLSTAHVLGQMNHLLQSQTRLSDVNVAMLYASLEKNGGNSFRFKVSNAGLISPILLRPGHPCEIIDACGLPMGIIEGPEYYECSLNLEPGDLLVLLSDGLVEAMNTQHEMFGFERLEAAIDAIPQDTSATEFLTHLQDAVSVFTGNAPQHDDMTVVALRVKTPPG